ncbi:MAG: heparinase II/III family protein [Fimbriimonadaceae bacterium]|nr:heparinase II/III family protein [Fimbriimonadaceae bacterium]
MNAAPLAQRFGIAPGRLRERPYLHCDPQSWPRWRQRLADSPSVMLQICRHDSRPGPTRPPRFNTAVLESAALVAAVTRGRSDVQFLKQWLDIVLASRGMDLIGVLRGHFLAALAFCYDLLGEVLSEPERAALGRTLTDHARRACEAVALGLDADWPLESPRTVATLVGLNLAGLAVLGEDPAAAHWIDVSDQRLDRVLHEVGTDGWWPTGFEDWNLLLPLLVRLADAWERLADRDRFDCGLLREAWRVALHGLAPSGREALDLDAVGHAETSRRHALAAHHPGAQYRWLQEPCTWALDRLALRFSHAGFRLAAERWRQQQLGRGAAFAVLWERSRAPANLLPDTPHHCFEAHGLAVWRSGWGPHEACLAFAVGPAYGQVNRSWQPVTELDGDANHFLLWWGGVPLAADGGRRVGGATRYHNTLLVDGEGQLPTSQHRPGAATLAAAWLTAAGGALLGRAAGAYPASCGLRTFDRHLAFADGYVLVWDQITAERPVRLEWLLHTSGTAAVRSAGLAELSEGEACLRVHALRPHQFRLATREVPDESPALAQLSLSVPEPLARTQFLVLLVPQARGRASSVEPTLVTGESAVGAVLAWPNGDREDVLFPTRGRGIVLDHLISDAASLALRRASHGDWTRLIARRVGQVLLPGGEVLTATQPVDVALELLGGVLRGEVHSPTGATVAIRCPFVPRGVLLDGASARARLDRAAQTVSLRLTAGRHHLRVTSR